MTYLRNQPTQDNNTLEPGYNDIGLYDTSLIASDVLWHKSIPNCQPQYCITRLERHSFITTINIRSLLWHYNQVRLYLIHELTSEFI